MFIGTFTGIIVCGKNSSLMPLDGDPSLPECGTSGGFSVSSVQDNGVDMAGEITTFTYFVHGVVTAGTQTPDIDDDGETVSTSAEVSQIICKRHDSNHRFIIIS
jgi:hypothetical protein